MMIIIENELQVWGHLNVEFDIVKISSIENILQKCNRIYVLELPFQLLHQGKCSTDMYA